MRTNRLPMWPSGTMPSPGGAALSSSAGDPLLCETPALKQSVRSFIAGASKNVANWQHFRFSREPPTRFLKESPRPEPILLRSMDLWLPPSRAFRLATGALVTSWHPASAYPMMLRSA